MNPLGLLPLVIGACALYSALRHGKPKGRFGSGVTLSDLLIQKLPEPHWRLVVGALGLFGVVFGIGVTWLGW
jgi:hypothetical protein